MAPKAMTNKHKKALAEGRKQGATVRAYLDILSEPVRRGRPRTQETVEARHAAVVQALESGTLSSVEVLEFTQERMNLEEELASFAGPPRGDRLAAAEEAFVAVAAEYSVRKGISYTAWRTVGVPAAVLKRAGIPRS